MTANILPRFVHVRSCPELLFEGGVDGNKGRCCTLVASAQQALSRQDVDTPVRALATGVSTVCALQKGNFNNQKMTGKFTFCNALVSGQTALGLRTVVFEKD